MPSPTLARVWVRPPPGRSHPLTHDPTPDLRRMPGTRSRRQDARQGPHPIRCSHPPGCVYRVRVLWSDVSTGRRWTVQELGPLIGHDPDTTEAMWRKMRRLTPGHGLRPPLGVKVLPPGHVPHTLPADRVDRFPAFGASGVLEGLLVCVQVDDDEGEPGPVLWELNARLRSFYTPTVARTEELCSVSRLMVPCSEAERYRTHPHSDTHPRPSQEDRP